MEKEAEKEFGEGQAQPAAQAQSGAQKSGSAGARRRGSKKRRITTTTEKSGKRPPRSYPSLTLEEALKIPRAIREQNNGNPWNTEDVARAALNVSRSNNKFFYTAAAARAYGLTIGTRDTDKVELAPLGRAIFFAENEETKQTKLREAFFSIDVFKRAFEHYGNAELPKKEFLCNTLQKEFGLDLLLHDEFTRIFKANCKFLGIEKGLGPLMDRPKKDTGVEHPSQIEVVGQPKGKFDRTAFVIMPFVEKGEKPRPAGFFSELLSSLITPAANAAGFSVETSKAPAKLIGESAAECGDSFSQAF